MPAKKSTGKAPAKITVEKKPSTVVSKAKHEEVIADYEADLAQQEAIIKEKKTEITSAKVAASKWQEKAAEWEAKYNSLKDKTANTIDDIGYGAGKFNDFAKRITRYKWVAALLIVALLAAIGFILWLKLHTVPNLEHGITARDAKIENLQKQIADKQQDNNYDSIHAENNHIAPPDNTGEKKNFSSKPTK